MGERGRTGLRRCFALLVLVVAVLLPAVSPAAHAAPPTPALQEALDRLVADGVPGAIALERSGDRSAYASAGVNDLATGEPIDPRGRFRIGSITKSYVSAAVLRLAGEGRLSLDDTVSRWLPGLLPNGDEITIRQLLNHTSGLADYIDLDFYLTILREPFRTWMPRELVARAVAQPPLFEPGAGWSYSNTGYIVLGLVLSRVEGLPQSLEMYGPPLSVYARIVAPLRHWQTSFPVTDPEIRGPHPHGYLLDVPPEWGLPATIDNTRTNMSWGWAAGAMISTLDEVARFHRALFTGRLLRPDQQRELQTTVSIAPGLGYGLGVFQLETPCGTAWGHDGGTPGYVSISLSSPDGSRQAGLMVTRDANTWTADTGVDFTRAYLTAFCGEAVAAADARAVTAAGLPDLARRLR